MFRMSLCKFLAGVTSRSGLLCNNSRSQLQHAANFNQKFEILAVSRGYYTKQRQHETAPWQRVRTPYKKSLAKVEASLLQPLFLKERGLSANLRCSEYPAAAGPKNKFMEPS